MWLLFVTFLMLNQWPLKRSSVVAYCSMHDDLAAKQTLCQPGGNDIGCPQSWFVDDLKKKKNKKKTSSFYLDTTEKHISFNFCWDFFRLTWYVINTKLILILMLNIFMFFLTCTSFQKATSCSPMVLNRAFEWIASYYFEKVSWKDTQNPMPIYLI